MFTNLYSSHLSLDTSTMNSLLFAGGNVGHRCMQILLDSGAALSVIRNDALDDRSRKSLTATSKRQLVRMVFL